ncbi:MAG: bifunctional diaminohydroxyphosphoribosylaminopyrimidine deaminase/5-amino-6-(5-phosphoribosylamino)uracil reductase RibD [Microbacteriaceae bacterium]
MTKAQHEFDAAMRRAMVLAANGPATDPNPQVGCVILDPQGHTLSEGWHRGMGTSHAEVDALSALTAEQSIGATAVVTLEPCNHTGHTPPCTEALLSAGIARVVYAVPDPGRVSGGGGKRLRAAGVEVVSGILAQEVQEFLADWLRVATLGRPIVTLKWASSLDGRAAAQDGSSRWITGTAARQRVHEQRAAADAIVVGTGTILADNPSLTARGDAGELMPHQPVPVILGTRPIPAEAAVFQHPRTPIVLPGDDLGSVLMQLRSRGIRRVFVEGGPTLASAFVASGLVDEFCIYLAPSLIGGPRTALGELGVGTIGAQRRLRIDRIETLGEDLLIVATPAAKEGS